MLKKIADEIYFMFEGFKTKSNPNDVFHSLFHIFLWGGGFLIMVFAIMMFVAFVILFFKSSFNNTFPILLISLISIIASYLIKKLRVRLYHDKKI